MGHIKGACGASCTDCNTPTSIQQVFATLVELSNTRSLIDQCSHSGDDLYYFQKNSSQSGDNFQEEQANYLTLLQKANVLSSSTEMCSLVPIWIMKYINLFIIVERHAWVSITAQSMVSCISSVHSWSSALKRKHCAALLDHMSYSK